ncbi:MAG TPA: WYL domain-containing protein [Acidiferrobacter sp.]|nr:WYL domain-containing protein [Acidiferrobacter sp.]
MPKNVLTVLTGAVESRHCCAIRYRDQTEARVVEPHAIYENENGEIIIDCYQVSGYSSASRPPPFWRPFRLHKINAAAVLRKTFAPRRVEGFNPTRERYRKGLMYLVSESEESFVRSIIAKPEPVGPFLPTKVLRR